MTLSGQQIAITRTPVTQVEYRVYLCDLGIGEFDESTIVEGWTPDGDWTDVTSTIATDPSPTWTGTKRGRAGSFTVLNMNRDEWPDERAVAIMWRFWDGGDWSPWEVAVWGYILGGGTQRRRSNGLVSGIVNFGYAKFWSKIATPGLKFGQENLMANASIVYQETALATLTSEIGLEFTSQAAGAGADALKDQKLDTCAIQDVLPGAIEPTLGDTATPKILRTYGSFTRGIAPGGQARWIEVWCGHNLTPWGTFTTPASVPNLFESGSNTRDDDNCKVEYSAGRMIITAKQNLVHPNQMHGIQWNFGIGDLPIRVKFRYKAGATDSIGKTIHVTHDVGETLSLGSDWRTYQVDLPKPANLHDTLVFRIQGGDNNSTQLPYSLLTDTVIEVDDLEIGVGYSDMHFQKTYGYKLSLCVDDGDGHEHVRRIAWDLVGNSEEWRIPAFGSIIFTDDLAAFRAQFDPGSRQVYQLKYIIPDWYFGIEGGVGVGRVKLAYSTNANMDDYDDTGLTTVDEIDFSVANGGTPWEEYQALSRQSPVGTGYFAPEDFPHLGLLQSAYNPGYWVFDLGAYQPTYITQNVAAAASTLVVDDPDEFPSSGSAFIDTDEFTYSGKSGRALTGVSGILAHDGGVGVGNIYPKVDGAKQTGWLVDLVEVRRKQQTPIIQAGAIIYSNSASPADPKVPDIHGHTWERHQDWTLLMRWDYGSNGLSTIVADPPGAYIQMRFVGLIIDKMQVWDGVDQRAKANELIVRRYSPGATAGNSWIGEKSGDLSNAAAHILTNYGGVPASKIFVEGKAPPIHDLPLTPSFVESALQVIENLGLVHIWLDRYNAVHIGPVPNSPFFDPVDLTWTWMLGDLRSEPSGDWLDAHQVSQVHVIAKETETWRVHEVRYPEAARRIGSIIDLTDIVVNSAEDVVNLAKVKYREGNHRRQITIAAGPCPWIEYGQWHVVNLPDLDSGAGWESISFFVESFTVSLKHTAGGNVSCETAIQLHELVLS